MVVVVALQQLLLPLHICLGQAEPGWCHQERLWSRYHTGSSVACQMQRCHPWHRFNLKFYGSCTPGLNHLAFQRVFSCKKNIIYITNHVWNFNTNYDTFSSYFRAPGMWLIWKMMFWFICLLASVLVYFDISQFHRLHSYALNEKYFDNFWHVCLVCFETIFDLWNDT